MCEPGPKVIEGQLWTRSLTSLAYISKLGKAFVWLNNYQSSDLALDIDTISKACTELAQCSIETDEQLVASAIYFMSDSLERPLETPWFKSIWTLRETVSRRDAVFINNEGELVVDKESTVVLRSIVTACTNVLAWLQTVKQRHQFS